MLKTLTVLALVIVSQIAQAAVKDSHAVKANAFVEMSCGLSGSGSVLYSLELAYTDSGIKFLKGSATFIQKDYEGKLEEPASFPVTAKIEQGKFELSTPQHPSQITVHVDGQNASGDFDSVIQNIKSASVYRLGYGGPAACIASSDVY